MGIRETLGEIDGLVLAFIGLTVVLALSAYLDMTFAWRVALGVPIAAAMLFVLYLRKRRGEA